MFVGLFCCSLLFLSFLRTLFLNSVKMCCNFNWISTSIFWNPTDVIIQYNTYNMKIFYGPVFRYQTSLLVRERKWNRDFRLLEKTRMWNIQRKLQGMGKGGLRKRGLEGWKVQEISQWGLSSLLRVHISP